MRQGILNKWNKQLKEAQELYQEYNTGPMLVSNIEKKELKLRIKLIKEAITDLTNLKSEPNRCNDCGQVINHLQY